MHELLLCSSQTLLVILIKKTFLRRTQNLLNGFVCPVLLYFKVLSSSYAFLFVCLLLNIFALASILSKSADGHLDVCNTWLQVVGIFTMLASLCTVLKRCKTKLMP